MFSQQKTKKRLETQSNIKSLLQFVSKNKTLSDALAKIESTNNKAAQASIQALQEAIETGNLHHDVFKDTNCDLYLISLYKNEKIDRLTFCDVYTYLMILMNFTHVQPLGQEENDVKFTPAKVEILSLTDDGIAKKFYDALINNPYANARGIFRESFSLDQFKQFISTLSNVGKNIFVITIDDRNFCAKQRELFSEHRVGWKSDGTPFHYPSVDSIFSSTHHEAPFYLLIEDNQGHNDNHICRSYSGVTLEYASRISSLLNNNENVIQPLPICGSINEETVFLFHQNGLHPFIIFSARVKSNPSNTHGAKGGPTLHAWHDGFAHTYSWGNRISIKQHHFIFHYLLPMLNTLFDKKVETLPPIANIFDTCIGNVLDLHTFDYHGKTHSQQEHFYYCLNNILHYKLHDRFKTLENAETFASQLETRTLTNQEFVILLRKLSEDREAIQNEYGIDVLDFFNEIKSHDHRVPNTADLIETLQTKNVNNLPDIQTLIEQFCPIPANKPN